jgi:Domain of unknown function (DUF397)
MAGHRDRYSLVRGGVSRAGQSAWRTSRRSADQGACVEVASRSPFVLVRDSLDRSGPVVEFTSVQWLEFVTRIRSGTIAAR